MIFFLNGKKEIEQEKRVIYINPEILPIFEKYKDLKKYCISDFYMGAKELQELLDYLKVPVKIEKIYSSADYKLNKEPVSVKKGDIVTYTFRIYNEGTIDGYAQEITEDIPDGTLAIARERQINKEEWNK